MATNQVRVRRIVSTVVLLVALAGCGGATTSSTAPAAAQATPAGAGAGSSAGNDSAAPGAAASPDAVAPSDGAAAAGDVCGLLTKEQVEDFTGFGLKEVVPDGPAACKWVLETDSMVPGAHAISVEVLRSGGRGRFDALSALDKVPGIGDGAVKSGGNTDGTAWAVKGDTLVKLVYALPVTVPDADPIALPLLELALNSLS